MKKFQFRRIGVADDQPSERPSLHDCIEVVLMQGDALLVDVLDGLAAASAKTKGLGTYGNRAPVSKTITDLLSSQASAMKKTFMTQLREGVYNSAAQDSTEQPLLRFEDLQLLDTQQIDASIELALAQQEVARCVDDVLPTLNALISSLLGWITVQAHHNPLKPEVFVRALHACLVQYAPDDQARSALIIPAAGLLGVSLRQLYREISDWLASQGVEPAMPLGVPVSTSGTAVSAKGTQGSVARTMVTLDKLRKLLSGEFDSGSGMPNFLHTVPASFEALEDMKLVEPMMKRLAQKANRPATGETRKDGPTLQVAHEQTQRRQLGQQLGEEVVRMMLDNLMQDQRLLLKVRQLIQTLEPVLLALSQSDPRFFSERQHPARQFLDRLTHRSLGYTTENDESFQRFLKSLTGAVEVLKAGDGSAAAFAQVLRELEAGWTAEEAVQRQQHEEAARALLLVEQRNLLAQSLANDFQERLKDKEVPELVANFLRGPWAQVVAQSRLSCADGTVDPDGYLALVDDLIWSVQLRLTRRNRNRLVQLVPQLLVKLRHGLQFIQYPEERIPVFFDALISWHERAFDGPQPLPASADAALEAEDDRLPEDEQESLEELQAPDAAGFWVAEDEAQESGYLAPDAEPTGAVSEHAWSVGELNTGAWVELLVDGDWVRAQLTWASPHRTLFMFISQGGLAHSMSRRSMERLRMQGSIRVVSDGHVLDNALDAVAQTALQNDMGQAEQRP